ncbi:glycogen synthase [Marinicellulosiphila megalodicopiae]|uniref:glycogen synthase n=1 Tax=Marinicellulosiphila megalodicopiae TaxID=2724896 RepID=UPI003BAE59EE
MDSKPLNILFLASEIEGFVKTGGLADVGRALPEELAKLGHNLCTCLPYYSKVDQQYKNQTPITFDFLLNHYDRYFVKAYLVNKNGVNFYLLEHDFFDRDGIYDDGYQAYEDNMLRFAFFSKACLELAKKINFQPEIVHANDWQTALAPFYLKEHYQFDAFFTHSKSVLTIHNGAYQGKAHARWLHATGINSIFFEPNVFEDYGDLNMLKGGIHFADKVNSVSIGYTQELRQPETGHGLHEYFVKKGTDLSGITNGCDYGTWDPSTDPSLIANFDLGNITGKHKCKAHLQTSLGLPVIKNIPLFVNISRLTDQKGHHFLIPALREFLNNPVQIAVLGSGDPALCAQLVQLQNDFPDKFHFTNGYSEALSHQMEAAGDYFIMPSVFEPCGLNQIYSMRYGTLPIVRSTGGLKDTVIALDDSNDKIATGLAFENCEVSECLDALNRANQLYYDTPVVYKRLQRSGFKKRFTWEDACKEYEALYEQA